MFTLCQSWLHYNNKNIDSFLKYFSLVGEADTHTAEACQCKEGGRDSPRGLPGEEDTGAEFGRTNENLTGRWGERGRAGEMPGLIQNRIKIPLVPPYLQDIWAFQRGSSLFLISTQAVLGSP